MSDDRVFGEGEDGYVGMTRAESDAVTIGKLRAAVERTTASRERQYDRVQELEALLFAEVERLRHPGGLHQYVRGIHRSDCMACDMLGRFGMALPEVSESVRFARTFAHRTRKAMP